MDNLPIEYVSEFRNILVVCVASSRIGCCIYHYDNYTISLIPDRTDPASPFKCIDLIIARDEPSVVVVSAVQNRVIQYISDKFPTVRLLTKPNQFFSISNGFKALMESEMTESKMFKSDEEKVVFILTKVRQNVDVCALRSIGCLHKIFLSPKQGAGAEQDALPTPWRTQELDSPPVVPILDVKYIEPGPIMSLDRFTYQALKIFDSVVSTQQREVPTKILQAVETVEEDLFKFMNRCSSAIGRRFMRTIFLWPLQSITEINKRLNTVEYFMDPSRARLRESIRASLAPIRPIAYLLIKLNHGPGSHRDMFSLYQSLSAALRCCESIKPALGMNIEVVEMLNRFDTDDLRSLEKTVRDVIDWAESRRLQRVELNFGIEEELDRQKTTWKSLPALLEQVSKEEGARYKGLFMRRPCKVIYVPRIGFLNSLDVYNETEVARISKHAGFDIFMRNENCIYFKTPEMARMDEENGDIECNLMDTQQSILVELQDEILKRADTILTMLDTCAYLDCLISFAEVATISNFRRPKLNESATINIVKGRHPVMAFRQNFVANDCAFYNNETSHSAHMMILTGPNSSGKTVFIKTNCLILFMAHLGSFVPAVAAEMPVIDAILTRLYSGHSVSSGLSSFANDLNQVSYAISKSTKNSIVAIDEFGRGTDPQDGFVLLSALIRYFAYRGDKSPFVLLSTHYHRALEDVLGEHDWNIVYRTFRVTRDHIGNIRYEYQLINGRCEGSMADNVAVIANVPETIIERAKSVRAKLLEGSYIEPRIPEAY